MSLSENPRQGKRARTDVSQTAVGMQSSLGERTPPRSTQFRPREFNAEPLIQESKRKRPKLDALRADGETLFTLEQVRKVVRDAVNLRDRQLREEYDTKLQNLLQEQFDNFTTFNQDYVSRMLRNSKHADEYIS